MPNRYVCSALKELRSLVKVYDDDYKQSLSEGLLFVMVDPSSLRHLKALTEEIQTHVNRMEASLQDRKDLEYWYERKKELKAECKKLKAKKEALESKKDKKKTKPYSDLRDVLHG